MASEIVEHFLRTSNEAERVQLAEKLKAGLEALLKKIEILAQSGNYESYVVFVSGKGEILSLGIARAIADMARPSLPLALISAFKHPMMLGDEFKDIYAGAMSGDVPRYFFEEKIGEENTAKLLDTPNLLIINLDDHMATGTKALSVLSAFQPNVADGSKVVFASPVAAQAQDVDAHPDILIGSSEPQLFAFLQKASLG